jgi:Radical SAM superfamily/4Fe-4S single cluster domain
MTISPFALLDARPLDVRKFKDPTTTAKGEPRASVKLQGLNTLWFNTGTLCNLACTTCYIESSPTNDALVYLSLEAVKTYLDEITTDALPTREIGFTGGEPFMNRDIMGMLEACLSRGFDVLVLTNAMRPMHRHKEALLALKSVYGSKLTLRVSLDHYTQAAHDAERGEGAWLPALEGLKWLSDHGFSIAIAGRTVFGESLGAARDGFWALCKQEGIGLDAYDPHQLVIFPDMDASADIAEISVGCWDILGKSPDEVMCASSRMIVHRKGEASPSVVACTLLPYDQGFDLGQTLKDAHRDIALNHPHCARFCVLGGASCSA